MNNTKAIIKKVLVFGISVYLLYILQTALFPYFELGGIVPNLLLILTTFYGFMRNTREGMIAGFFCGLVLDLSTGLLFGVHILALLLIGFMNGAFRKIFYGDDVKLPILFTGVSDLFYGLFMYLFFFVPRGSTHFSYFLMSVMIPEAVYSVIVAFVLYFIYAKIFEKLDRDERKVEHIL
ncbi:MAG: rod shape-determining protein MreD [Lachnospiraceae bacterium]|nr:rod shape-determining protein MreD [Lachnospiraceae bacterium]